MPGFRFHDLRHTAITDLAENGAADLTIMGIAGHISPRMLERYSHARMKAKRKAIEALALSTKAAGYGIDAHPVKIQVGGGGYDTNDPPVSTRPV